MRLLLPLIATLLLTASRAEGHDPADDYLFVLTSEHDYTAGSFSLIELTSPWEGDLNLAPMHTDNVAVTHNGLIYVVNRWGGDNIQVLDPAQGHATVRQFSVGTGSNPHDIAFVSDTRAFVTRYESAELWEVDPSTGEHTDTIDLSPLADSDGLPEMDGLAIHDGSLYVSVQRLDRSSWPWVPEPPSYLAVIDLADNTLRDIDPQTPGIQGIALAATNPNSLIHVDPMTGDFLIGEQGIGGVLDGGIERIDPETGESGGFVVTEETLGNDLYEWDGFTGRRGFAVTLTQPDYGTEVVAFDFSSGERLATLLSSNLYVYADVIIDPYRDQAVIADRTLENPGLRIFSMSSLEEMTQTVVSTGLFPHHLLKLPASGTGVGDSEPLASRPLLNAWPQPAVADLSLQLDLSHSAVVDLTILDLNGRCVARLLEQAQVAPDRVIRWDGRDDACRHVPAGTYLARIQGPRLDETRILRMLH